MRTKLGWNSENKPMTDCFYEVGGVSMSALFKGHISAHEADQILQSLRRVDLRNREMNR